MSNVFFEDLNMPMPDIFLRLETSDNSGQIADIITAYSKVIRQQRPDMVIVCGDVNSTVACALATKKTDPSIPLVHIEAGLRSRDRSMPEEINRIITDTVSDYFFTTSRSASAHLIDEQIDPDHIFFTGNTMIDTLLRSRKRFKQPPIWHQLRLEEKKYIVLTLHRQSNIRDAHTLKILLGSISDAAAGLPVIFPVHPHTAKMMQQFSIEAPGIYCTEPMGYLEFNYLVERSAAVVTDSGGISEETTIMNIPCMTLRSNTERPETCTVGTNVLLGNNPVQIKAAFRRLFDGKWQQGKQPELWDGKAANRIVTHIIHILNDKYIRVADDKLAILGNKEAMKMFYS